MIQHPSGFVYCYACIQNFRASNRPVPLFPLNVYDLNVNNPMPPEPHTVSGEIGVSDNAVLAHNVRASEFMSALARLPDPEETESGVRDAV